MSSRSVQIIGGPDNERSHAHVDSINNSLVTMNEIHRNIHLGIFFSATRLELGLVNDGDLNLLVIATSRTHVRFTVSVEGQAQVAFFEGTTVTDNGTPILAANRNRNSAKTATTTVFHAPTITADGTELTQTFIPGGTGGSSEGSSKTSFEEWLLAPGNYLLRLTNTSGTASDVSAAIEFYEPGL